MFNKHTPMSGLGFCWVFFCPKNMFTIPFTVYLPSWFSSWTKSYRLCISPLSHVTFHATVASDCSICSSQLNLTSFNHSANGYSSCFKVLVNCKEWEHISFLISIFLTSGLISTSGITESRWNWMVPCCISQESPITIFHSGSTKFPFTHTLTFLTSQ